jgi:hypothetical protein
MPPHLLPQVPQLRMSLSGLTHRLPQHLKGAAQVVESQPTLPELLDAEPLDDALVDDEVLVEDAEVVLDAEVLDEDDELLVAVCPPAPPLAPVPCVSTPLLQPIRRSPMLELTMVVRFIGSG